MKNTFKLNTNSVFETNATIRSFFNKVSEVFEFNVERTEVTYSNDILVASVYISKMPLRTVSLIITGESVAEIRLTKVCTTDYKILNRECKAYKTSTNWFMAQTISQICEWRDENLTKVED